MKTSPTPMKRALVLALCAATLAPMLAAAQSTASTAKAPEKQLEKQAEKQGDKPANMTVLPGDDFFAYANGDWLARTEIPADRGSWSAMGALAEETNTRIAKLIEELGAAKATSGEARKVADFYAAYMDEAGIEKRGLAPIQPMLKGIAAIKDKAALVRALGASVRADVDPLNATDFYTENLFGLWVAGGLTDPSRNLPYLLQGGLGLPDRAYYLENNARMAELRTRYQQHIAAMMKLAGFDKPEERAARVFELELALAQTHATREESADIQKSNNVWSAKDFAARAPGIDWAAFFKAAGLQGQERFQVYHPSAVIGAAKLLARADVATWRDYLAFHQINQYASLLPKAFADQRFEFNGKALTGTPQQSARWKRALAATNEAMDEAVGKIYVGRYFPAENKAKVQAMVANIIDAFSRRIDKLDWMAPATRAQAQAKVKSLYVGIGYPERWKSYDGLQVAAGDAFGNAVRAEEYRYKQELAKLGKKPERTDWAMPPQLVNAVNLPLQNALNFPAAILQPPFFDPNASDAANYGAIGSIIGHEISHSFDDQGAQFDAQGRLRDWWTKEDLAHFKTASNKLVAQYGSYKPFPDLAVNGQLTLSENLADLAGLAAAYDAFKTTPAGKVAAADRQFFTGFARAGAARCAKPRCAAPC
ncbi:M13 family metallopeptidase [Massilia sp. Dwa41.01b]|uniref:M13 family metallopeptidase n=1 Tax=Massilia sp. Dwa41.01b TaxID=2709302 RepID=UPI0022772C04|nr:M13 family metallopeptidase [Massilia sp. Dwa41.01b]